MAEFKFRELTGNDLMTMLGLMDKLSLTDIVGEFIDGYMTEERAGGDYEAIGAKIVTDLVSKLIPRIPAAKDDVNAFLGDVAGMTQEEVGELPLTQYVKLVRDFFKVIDVSELLALFTASKNE